MAKSDGYRPPGRHVCGPRRSHPAGDPGSSCRGRGLGHGTGQAVRPEPPRRFQTPESAAARRPDHAEPQRAVEAVPPGGRPPQGGFGLGGGLPALLGRKFPAPGRRIAGFAQEGERSMTTKGATNVPKTEYVIEPGKQDIKSTTMLDAPRELVFRAYTDPKLFVQWWGPRQYEVEIDKFESRPGGSWRVVHVAADGGRHAFRGVNHDVIAPERICRTFEYEGVPGHVALETATFEAVGNKTRLLTHQVFETVMDRDGMVASGMEEGANESIERLSELLDKMKAGK